MQGRCRTAWTKHSGKSRKHCNNSEPYFLEQFNTGYTAKFVEEDGKVGCFLFWFLVLSSFPELSGPLWYFQCPFVIKMTSIWALICHKKGHILDPFGRQKGSFLITIRPFWDPSDQRCDDSHQNDRQRGVRVTRMRSFRVSREPQSGGSARNRHSVDQKDLKRVLL